MKILLISPLGFPYNQNLRYGGIERLVGGFAQELIKEHQVTVMGHADSEYAEGVFLLPTQPQAKDIFLLDELQQYQSYQHVLRGYDVIHDFSHQHFASRNNINLPSLNIFWHSPAIAQYPKAPYNIIALSNWAAREFKRVYHQEARYQESIAVDNSVYKLSNKQRTERFLTLGAMTPRKGNLEAAQICKKAGLELDIVGARGAGERQGFGERSYSKEQEAITDYERSILNLCDGRQIKYLGEVTDEKKIKLMQTCRALVYVSQEPEVTNHKVQEAMFCGAPVVVSTIGAMPEIVAHGVNGYLCRSEQDWPEFLKSVHKLRINDGYCQLVEKYSVPSVCANYVKLYEKVRDGLRW